MAIFKDTFLSYDKYNRLPYINEVAAVPDDRAKDLEDLRRLLAKHNVPGGVSVRLVHKHFDAKKNEVMSFRKLATPSYGTVLVMKPVLKPLDSKLKGIHFFVDDDGSLQAYEYTTPDEVIDLSEYQPFVDEFCHIVMERGLQHQFGLKLKARRGQASFTEFEFSAERSTIMIPEGLPVPDAKFEISVNTEWDALAGNRELLASTTCSGHFVTRCVNHASTTCHSHCFHCFHPTSDYDSAKGMGLVLGGFRVEEGTPVWQLVHEVVEAW